ncbi:alpha/beta fold hydrolase [Endozoicomonas arenosclerae]|uniref:alpha/beta fold hydrolase n=1 Tax=Endozoicomonas arenosclerae TaxID=1633495 RepID=UPI00078638BD|nr:alpha/beta fold hydrolase [Endozoicomonas arenosclerae]
MSFVQINNEPPLYFEKAGEDKPLILITGLSGNASFWHCQREAFAEAHQVITYDQRGSGKSPLNQGDISIDHMVTDLLNLMNWLDIEEADIVGHSLGGAIAQTLALNHPDRVGRLVLSSTWSKPDLRFLRLHELRSAYLQEFGALAYLKTNPLFLYPAWWLRQHPELLEVAEQDVSRLMPDQVATLARMEVLPVFETFEFLSNIQSSTLVMGADDDMVTPTSMQEELVECIPDARIKLFSRGGHFYPQVRAEAFNQAVLQFLDDAS